MYGELLNADWSSIEATATIDEACLKLYDIINTVISNHTPVYKTRRREYPPWFTKEIINNIKAKNNYRKSGKMPVQLCAPLSFLETLTASELKLVIESKPSLNHGKDGYKWAKSEPACTRTAARNIIVSIPGAKDNTRRISNEEEAWRVLFNATDLEKTTIFTNQVIERQKVNYSSDTRYLGPTERADVSTLIGLLYISGSRKDPHFESCDIPHSYCTIDEQLLGFHGRYPFRVYMASEPDRYGIKVVCMCDIRPYLISAKRIEKNSTFIISFG
nr:unnamed protein product [Callosobruchus analis]